jgi:hypothetical protein
VGAYTIREVNTEVAVVEVNVGFGVVTAAWPVSVETGMLFGDVLPGWTGAALVVEGFCCGVCEDGCAAGWLVLLGALFCGGLEGEDWLDGEDSGIEERETGVEDSICVVPCGAAEVVGGGLEADAGAAVEGWAAAIEKARKHG